MMAIHQWEAQKLAAAGNRAMPMRAMVGAMASGPINRSSTPIIPLNPITTWNSDAKIIAPCI